MSARRRRRNDDRAAGAAAVSTICCRTIRARAGVVLDPRSGAVLAIASVPSYDPNDLDAEFRSLTSDPSSPLLDRALDGLLSAGIRRSKSSRPPRRSTTAPSRWIRTSTIRAIWSIGNYTLHDNESEATGYQDLTNAFALSSNVDFAQIALKMGVDDFYRYLDRWGIGDSLDFQLPAQRASRAAEGRASFPENSPRWGSVRARCSMTPLQMALIGATIADGGVEPRPFVVRQVVRDGAAASVFAPKLAWRTRYPPTRPRT